jgi:hypothetical protein
MRPEDRAAEYELLDREIALQKRNPVLPATGFCHNCNEELGPELKFCNADCRDDYELRKRLSNA